MLLNYIDHLFLLIPSFMLVNILHEENHKKLYCEQDYTIFCAGVQLTMYSVIFFTNQK